MNNAVFRKTMENIWKYRDIKFVTTEPRRNYLVYESNYHATKAFSKNLVATEMRKTQTLMNKAVYLGLSILEISKIVRYKFWYNYVKPKYDKKENLCYLHTDCFIFHIKTNDIYQDIAGDVETRSDTSNYQLNQPLLKGKNEKVMGLVKDELGGKIKKMFWIKSKNW